MSSSRGASSRPSSRSSKRSASSASRGIVPAPTLTPENAEGDLAACAATQHLLLLAQHDKILCLRHDTLAVEHRLENHTEEILWICVDSTSERGNGKLAVSYDVGNTAIVWDLHAGVELSRFVAYDKLLCAAFMRNGNIAFGNVTGSLVLFDPANNEHVSARLIFDPVTAIAPSWDCRHFACGFMNGTILICKIQPNFTIVHTLPTPKGPSKVTGIAWHGSSAKSKTEMLATQMADGDARVWSIPKDDEVEHCTIVRTLSESEGISTSPNWFAWSRSGRIVQFRDKETRMYDVRTKSVTMSRLEVAEGVVGLAAHTASSTLFVITSDFFIQQWNLNPDGDPILVRQMQQIPAKRPPSPPGSRSSRKRASQTAPPVLPVFTDSETSGDEDKRKSPMERIHVAMDADEEQESRDGLGPLSPGSSHSSASSRSARRRMPTYLYDKPVSRSSSSSRESVTEFSLSQNTPQRPRDAASVKSGTSYRSSLLRREVMRSPQSPRDPALLDLFPYVSSRLTDLPFRTPKYGDGVRTPHLLRKEMLRVVFGWEDDIRPLIHDELKRHPPGSSRAVLLLKWLGELGSDSIVSIMGSQTMTSSDWMLLALSSIDRDSQRKAGEAFVQRLLEKGDIHPAVAILLGIGEHDEAIEAYVSQKCYMEALLLTCLILPSNWDRQCFLLRKWGEVAVKTGNPELAVRIFSCTSEQTTEPWASPRAQDAIFKAQSDAAQGGAANQSPSSPDNGSRLTTRNAALKLITTFPEKGSALLPVSQASNITPVNGLESTVTPIADSALSLEGQSAWYRQTRKDRDPASAISARTATPGSYNRRRESSTRSGHSRTSRTTPQTASKEFPPALTQETGRRPMSMVKEGEASTSSPASYRPDVKVKESDYAPSPIADAISRLRKDSRARNGSRDRMPEGLHLDVIDTAFLDSALSPAFPTQSTDQSGASFNSSNTGFSGASSPPLTAGSGKGRALEHYLNQLEQAGITQQRAASRARGESRSRVRSAARSKSRGPARRDASESRGRKGGMACVGQPKRSPTSPMAMSPDEVIAAQSGSKNEAEIKIDSPIEERGAGQPRSRKQSLAASSSETVEVIHDDVFASERGRAPGSAEYVSAPTHAQVPIMHMPSQESISSRSTPHRLHRSASVSYPAVASLQRTPNAVDEKPLPESPGTEQLSPTSLSRKELAARELERRRQSLARRPSAPNIPLPGDAVSKRPQMGPRSRTELGDSPISHIPLYLHQDPISRSQSVDQSALERKQPPQKTASPGKVAMGLPANPRAMLHARSMSFNTRGDASVSLPPALPQEDDKDGYSSSGSMLSPLLPSTTYTAPPRLDRSASVPIDYMPSPQETTASMSIGDSPTRRIAHSRSKSHVASSPLQHSPPIVTASIDETIHESDVTIEVHDPPLLPELQHLVEPPPPPPGLYSGSTSAGNSPTNLRRASLGFTTTVRQRDSLDESRRDTPVNPAERAMTTSPQSQRRGRGSISEVKTGFGSRIRTAVTERMRSTSRSGNKSPPTVASASPYETVLPPNPFNGGGTSPVQTFGAGLSPLSRTAQRGGGFEDGRQQLVQQMGYVRNPREIRANMPPDALGQGGYVQPVSAMGGHVRKASGGGRIEGE